jgi:spermidine/putrescine transport system permease protein
MNRRRERLSRALFRTWAGCAIVFMYLPIFCVALASIAKNRYFRFPVPSYDTKWYEKAFSSLSVRDLFYTSLTIALLVALISVVLAFFGALAFARYDWAGRKIFQKIVLLPIFFPQAVLGLALLLWFSSLGIIPDWKTAVFAHLVWIVPIATLIISIQAYGLDPALEDAAFDLGATRWQVLREITLPILAPGIFSGFLFSFLLSWGNFPLSLFTTGADSTLPEWLYAKMVAGYTPLVPALGTLTTVGAATLLMVGYLIFMFWRRRQEAGRHGE